MMVEPVKEEGAFEEAGIGEGPAFWFTDIGNFVLGTCATFNKRTRVTGFMAKEVNDWSMNIEVLPDLTIDLKTIPWDDGAKPWVKVTFYGPDDKVRHFLQRFTKRLRRVPDGIERRDDFESITGVDPDEADAAWSEWVDTGEA